MEKVSPIKFSVNYILNLKCQNCTDKNFCKLQDYYKQLENPKITDLENLTKCLYYKKQQVSIQYRNKVS